MMFWKVLVLSLVAVTNAYPQSDLRLQTGRIVGGTSALIDDAPYQVSLMSNNRHTCGGAIITSRIIVTAAHCVYRSTAEGYSVRVGSTTRSKGGRVIEVEEIIWNDDFSYNDLDSDVALLKLKEDIEFNDQTAPVEMVSEGKIFEEGSIAVVTGWGAVREGGSIPETLQMVLVPVVSEAKCKEAYGKSYAITNTMMCAGQLSTGGFDACQGDSGGPLLVRGKLAGIVSWGLGCARPGYPGVYSSVEALRGWIDKHVELLTYKDNLIEHSSLSLVRD